jgi:ubiquinone/menaquinone biosynthesis C-methylase UbiE
MNRQLIQQDFDEIARLSDGASATDRYDRFLMSLVPSGAMDVLDVGCGLGGLTSRLAVKKRVVVGLDLSANMIARARQNVPAGRCVSFLTGDFLEYDFGARQFDCVISAATLHHMDADVAVGRMVRLLRPYGRLIVQDLRRDTAVAETVRAYAALAPMAVRRFVRTGRLRSPRPVREAWARHSDGERYLSQAEAHDLADRLLPGARVFDHWLWRYTLVWDKIRAA